MKEAAVCGGRGQVMEKVWECGLKRPRDARLAAPGKAARKAASVESARNGVGVAPRACQPAFESARPGHTSAVACMGTSRLRSVEILRKSRGMPLRKGARKAARQ